MSTPTTTGINTDQKQQIKRYLLMLALCISLSISLIAPFFVIGERSGSGCCGGAMPVTHDMVMHLNQMQGFYSGLAAGRFYPRWQENTNFGFGAPTTIFYPPVIYYLTSVLYFVTADWMMVIKALYVLLMIGSGVAMFVLARRLFSYGSSLVAMGVYLGMPYHLLNHYQRGALAECLSFIWMPLTLFFVVDLICKRGREKGRMLLGVSGLALCWGLFVLSHPPTAYQFLLIGGPVMLGFSIARRRWKELARVGAGLLLGLLISAVYLLPAVVEQRYVHAQDIELTWPYHESYIMNGVSTRYDHRGDDFVVRLDRLWLAGLVGLLVLGLSLEAIRRYRNLEAFRVKETFRLWLVMGLFASFMMLASSKSIGSLIPKIEIGVFAWRMLAITSLALALLFGHLAEVFGQERRVAARGRRPFAGISLAVVGSGFLAVSVCYVILPMYRAQAFVANPAHSNYALVPLAAGKEFPRRPEVTFSDGVGEFSIEKWDPEYRIVRLQMTRPGTVSLRTLNFPGWTASTNAGPVSIKTGPLGEVSFDLDAGAHVVRLEFKETGIRRWGFLISCFGTIALAVTFGLGLRPGSR